jgi:hypothetical protein
VSHYADLWTTIMLGCDGYPIKATDPPMRWDRHPTHKQAPINTSFPLLFISNSADPVTPLYAGVKMARKFVGAGLVEQLSEGHCSAAVVSICTLKKVAAYIYEGKVPPPPKWGEDGGLEGGEWDKCERDQWPFKGNGVVKTEGFDAQDMRMVEAWKNVGENRVGMSWFGSELSPQWIQLAKSVQQGMKLESLVEG